MQIPSEDIIELLPDSVIAELTCPKAETETDSTAADSTGESAKTQEKILPITGWECAEYVQDEEGYLPYRGEFVFRAQMGADEEGRMYEMAEETEPVNVRLVFDAPMMMANGITDFSQFKEAVSNGGTVTLTQDITMTETITVRKDVVILSSGNHTIKRGAGCTGSMFKVSGAKLTLGDGSSTSTLILDGGAVWSSTQDAVLKRGRTNTGITASSSIIHGSTADSVIVLKGNTVLQNNDCSGSGYGGAVTLQDSKLKIEGAKICSNKSGGGGGAVKTYKGSAVEMTGGEISQNEAGTHGGAFQIYSSQMNNQSSYESVLCKISGGSIQNNLASSVGGGIAVSDHSRLELAGSVVIQSNKTTDYQKRGGGIGFIDSDTMLTVSGQVQIKDNLCGTNANNLAVGIKNNLITIGQLEPSALIGITTINTPSASSPISITGTNSADYSGRFQSDNVQYAIVDGTNHVVQLVKQEVHTHRLTKHEAVPAQCLQDGTGEYWKCEGTGGCNKMFLDAAGRNEITQITIIPATGHKPDESEWKKDVEKHWYVCKNCSMKVNEAFHQYDGQTDMVCNVCAYDRTSSDKTLPTGTIHIAENSWTRFLNTVTFGLFFKETKKVTIEAQDADSGVDKTYYYISDSALSLEQVKALDEDSWIEGNTVSISPDRRCVIYAKITDKAGNMIYISSDGLVLDATAPAISGVTDGEICYESKIVTVRDENLKSVTVNDTEVTLQDGKFTLEAESGEQTITATDKAGNTATITVIMHEHSYGTEWKYDAESHWHECACKDKSELTSHNFGGWVTDKEATESEEGQKHRTCQTCKYEENAVIPALGKIDKDVQTDGKAPATQISTSTEELADMLLTDGEKKEMENGKDIKIILDVKDAGNSVSVEDKRLVEETLKGSMANGYTMGQYLDISLYKMIGDSRTDITETEKKIRIVIDVPHSLKNVDSKRTRTFAIIRTHGGSAEILTDLDNNEDTITMETDRFSTYAIVYKDTPKGGNNGSGNDSGVNSGGGGSGSIADTNSNDSNSNKNRNTTNNNSSNVDAQKDDEPKTGDATNIELYATLSMIAGLAYLLLYFADRKRGMTEETKKELVFRLVGWAKRGGKTRKLAALITIFILLVYYHSIGKKTYMEWKEIYGE